MAIDEREGGLLFGGNAKDYDRIRPDYPPAFYDELTESRALFAGAAVLDVGAGSGIATRELGMRGARVTALEPDERFVGLLTGAHEVITARFEETDPGQYDLIVVATAYHWLDPAKRVRRIADNLKSGGHLCLMWNVFGDADKEDAFHEATQRVLTGLDDSPSGSLADIPFALRRDERVAELENGGLFRLVSHLLEKRELTLDPGEVRALYGTFSPIRQLDEVEREAVLDELENIATSEFAGRVTRYMTSVMYLFRRP